MKINTFIYHAFNHNSNFALSRVSTLFTFSYLSWKKRKVDLLYVWYFLVLLNHLKVTKLKHTLVSLYLFCKERRHFLVRKFLKCVPLFSKKLWLSYINIINIIVIFNSVFFQEKISSNLFLATTCSCILGNS